MLHVTIIESEKGFRPIVECRASRRAYVEPVYFDSYGDAMRFARDVTGANRLGDWRKATKERKLRRPFVFP